MCLTLKEASCLYVWHSILKKIKHERHVLDIACNTFECNTFALISDKLTKSVNAT